MLNHFNQMFLRRILITVTALINGTMMMTLILNGSNRIQCILSIHILDIICVRILQCKPYQRSQENIDAALYQQQWRMYCMQRYTSTFCYYGGVIISRLCIVQHSMIGVMLILLLYINSFSFYPVHILTLSSFEICNVFVDIAMVLSV